MRPRYILTAALTACLLCALSPVCALVEGQECHSLGRWTFAIDTIVEGVHVSGTMAYDMVGHETAYVYDVGYGVDVLRVTGSFEGSSLLSGVESVISGVYDGYSYQVEGSPAVLMSEMATIANITSQMGTLQLSEPVEMFETLCYIPPLMSGFNPGSAEPDDQWNETTEARQVTSYRNGTVVIDDEAVIVMHTEYSVDSVDESVETEAGVFECIRLFAAQNSSAEVIWYSPEVQRSVRTERYDNTSTEPVFVAELCSYQPDDDSDRFMLLLVVMGVATSVVILVVTVIFAMRRRGAPIVRSEGIEDVSPHANVEDARKGDKPGNDGRLQ
jgi:hypothetical protein